jgi:hypothetical protein
MSLTTSGSPEIALADQGVEVEPVALPARAQIKHRREIERDADAGKLSALAPAIGLGLRLALIRRHGRKCRQRRLLRQRRRQMRDDAALLVGRNDQRRQMGRGARGLQAGDLGFELGGGPAGDIVPGHIDAGDQALAGQRGGFRRIVVADHEMASEQARNRSLGVQRLVLRIAKTDCAAMNATSGTHHVTSRTCFAMPSRQAPRQIIAARTPIAASTSAIWPPPRSFTK